MFSWSMKCWSDVLERASTSLSAASLPTQVDLEIQYFTRPNVRWTLQLWDGYVRFKTLKIGCHVGSEEDLVESLPRSFKGSLRSHWFQFRKVGDNWNISLESCSQIFEETRKIQDSVQFMGICVHPKSFCHVRLFATLWTVPCQASLSMGFSRQEYWSGLSCPPPGDLPDTGVSPRLSCLLHWQLGSLPLAPPGTPEVRFALLCLVAQSCSTLRIPWTATLWTVPCQAPLSMGNIRVQIQFFSLQLFLLCKKFFTRIIPVKLNFFH